MTHSFDDVPLQAQRRLNVFLCHSSEDKTAVRDLCHRLKVDGFAPWLDEEKLLPGHNWRREIPAAVRASDVVVVCLSQNSVNKEGYVQKEIGDALSVAEEKPEGTIFIIPGRMEDIKVPARLAQWHWANLFEKDGYHRLVDALKVRASGLGITVVSAAAVVPRQGRSEPSVQRQALGTQVERLVQESAEHDSKEQLALERAERTRREGLALEHAERIRREQLELEHAERIHKVRMASQPAKTVRQVNTKDVPVKVHRHSSGWNNGKYWSVVALLIVVIVWILVAAANRTGKELAEAGISPNDVAAKTRDVDKAGQTQTVSGASHTSSRQGSLGKPERGHQISSSVSESPPVPSLAHSQGFLTVSSNPK